MQIEKTRFGRAFRTSVETAKWGSLWATEFGTVLRRFKNGNFSQIGGVLVGGGCWVGSRGSPCGDVETAVRFRTAVEEAKKLAEEAKCFSTRNAS